MESLQGTIIPPESIYSELNAEMRRHRDYEIIAATWYTAILIALIGFYVSAKFGGDIHLVKFTQNYFVKFFTLLLSCALGISSIYSVHYAHRQYDAIRKIVDDNLEPIWSLVAFKPIREEKRVPPRRFIYLIQSLLVLVTLIVIWMHSPVR